MGCGELQPNDCFRFVGDDKHETSFPRGNRDYKSIAEGFIIYDYLGRRVEKKVYTGSAGDWTLEKHERFVYDGYEQVEKLDALNSNAIAQKFVWNGERILSVNNGTDTYYYTQDANKNVSELLAPDGTIKAHYEYSPFGKVTISNGIYADDNPYRFSSEVADDETGLVYYNYRYYSAELGRWLSRDPIGEKGGFNLYAMVGNDAVGGWDWRGLKIWLLMSQDYVNDMERKIKGGEENVTFLQDMKEAAKEHNSNMRQFVEKNKSALPKEDQERILNLTATVAVVKTPADVIKYANKGKKGDHFILHAHSDHNGRLLLDKPYNWNDEIIKQMFQAFKDKCKTLTISVCYTKASHARFVKQYVGEEVEVYYSNKMNYLKRRDFNVCEVYNGLQVVDLKYDPTAKGRFEKFDE